MPADINKFLDKVTIQHRDKPKFMAFLEATIRPLMDIIEVVQALNKEYDIDTATGWQLDVIGEWVGRSRYIKVGITDVYFAWNNPLDSVGWSQGIWYNMYDPSEKLTALPDDAYRMLLKTKIMLNNWDGTIDYIYEAWGNFFGDEVKIIIEDHQDMSISIGIASAQLSQIMRYVFLHEEMFFKCSGVRVRRIYQSTSGDKILFWNAKEGSDRVGGWGPSSWAGDLNFKETNSKALTWDATSITFSQTDIKFDQTEI